MHLHVALPQNIRLHLGTRMEVIAPAPGELGEDSAAPHMGYVLLGEGVPFLTEEHRLLLACTASLLAGRTVRVVATNPGEGTRPFGAVEPLPAPEPVPMTKQELHRFASEHGYSKARAGRVWNTLFYTERDQPEEHQSLPPVRYLGFAGQPPYGDSDERVLDLRSVYDRLVVSECRREVWCHASTADVNFLVHVVNERLKVDPPLEMGGPEMTVSQNEYITRRLAGNPGAAARSAAAPGLSGRAYRNPTFSRSSGASWPERGAPRAARRPTFRRTRPPRGCAP